MGAMATVELGGDGPLVVPLAVEVADLPCGSYSLAGTFECEGQTRQFESQSFNVAGDFVTKYDQWMDEWKARVEALRNRQIKYPFQLEFAEMALHLLGRHGSQELQKASPGLAQRRPWWPINWAVQLDGMLDALEADRDYFANRSGILLGGYRSKVDGTLQPYEITLPEGYDRSKKWPTLFAIHGTSSHYYYSLVALVERGYQPITKWPMVCVGLDGRAGPTPHGGLADVDFLEVYEQLRQHLGLDTERVYMTGYSRGGMATWYYAVQLPYMFAAVSPCAPFGYASTGELANVRHMPVNSYHGVHDPRTANANGPMMIGALNSLEGKGYHMQIRVAGHDLKAGYRDRAFMERLLAVKAPAYPKDVEFVCDRPRYSRAYWVNIDRMIDYGRSAHVKVNVVAARTIAVNTDNVGALTLDLSGGQVDKGAPLRIVLNGEERSMEYADQLRIQIQPADGALVKTPELGGPIGDWMFEKSLIVYGTQANENTAAAYKKLAEQISTGGTRTRWLYVHDTESQWPIKADSEVTADDVRDANLVLLGGPGANSVSTRIADRLPLKFQSDRLSVGDVVVNGPDAEVLFIYPNPQNRRRYVVVLGVADPNIKPSAGASGFKSLTSDLVIVRGKTDERLPGRLCFDAGWQFQPPETLYQVPAGIKADWRELLLDAAKAETGADVTFRLSYDRARPISEGPLYYADVLSGVTDAALIAIEMTGAEFESYLQSWITFYGKPPLLRGMDLEWSIDPASHVARVEKTGLDPKRSYTIVSDEVSASRPTWDVPEHVQYHLLPINSADVVVRYLQAGKLKSPQ